MSVFYLLLRKVWHVSRRKNREREGIRTVCDFEITGTLHVCINFEHPAVFHKKIKTFIFFKRCSTFQLTSSKKNKLHFNYDV